MKSIAWYVFLLVSVVGCATGYQPSGFKGGYTETQLSPDIFRVSFGGNAYTSAEAAANYTLLRSAELALENDHPYFVIIDEHHSSSTSAYTTPTQTTTTASVTAFGNTAHGSASSTTTGGQTYYFAKPGTSNLILLLKSKEGIDGIVYDAAFLRTSLRNKYGLDK